MKLHRIVASFAALLLSAIVSPAANALDVTLYLVTTDANNFTTFTPLNPPLPSSDAAINLDSDSPVGGPKTYFIRNGDNTNGPQVVRIQKCSGCSGRARVFVSEGSVDKLVLTDAQITNVFGSTATVRIEAAWTSANNSGPAGDYPYAVELSGTFTAPLGQSATNPTNRIEVAGRSATNCDGPCPLIDNPDLDPGEDVNVYPGANKYSLVAPPFLGAGAASFAPKEQQVTNCSNVYVCVPNEIEGQTCSSFCRPALGLDINVTLNNGHGAKLPGSIGAFHVPSRCEPGSTDPERLKGCEILADLFASLGPKGFTVYDVRLEPSPGSQRDVDLRQGIANSTTPWVTKRGAPDDGGDGLVSNTRVRLATNGGGDIRASGLCPAAGCASPKVLTVRIYCGQASEPAGETVLQLNSKGDGKADLGFSLPCVDPAVLVIDPLDHSWVAAPAIF